jgi:tRNA(fMet)-specific endonuclease VapC
MKLLLDTNRYTDLAKGDLEVAARVAEAAECWMSVIVLGELRAGFEGGSQSEENERKLDEFLSRPTAGILRIDEDTTRIYAHTLVTLRRQGTPIPTNDIWIAAQAIQHKLTLDTRDQHFEHVPSLDLTG